MLRKFLTLSFMATMAISVAPVQAKQARECLADVIYAEARGESLHGQKAVGEVVVNRVGKTGFASSVCGVTRQKGQFAKPPRVSDKGSYQKALKVADDVLAGNGPKVTSGATYFHTPSVKPSWSHRKQRTGRIGSHIFYK